MVQQGLWRGLRVPIIAAQGPILNDACRRRFSTTHFLSMLSLQSCMCKSMCLHLYQNDSIVRRQFIPRMACTTAFGHLLSQLRQLLD